MINKDLIIKQNWNLNQKIDHSLGVLEDFYNKTDGKIVVLFSGGKDSTVLLHLTRILYPETKGLFVNTTNEFSEILRFVRQTDNIDTVKPEINFFKIIDKYGFPLVSKKIARMITDLKNVNDNNSKTINLYLTGMTSTGQYCPSFKLPKKWLFLKDEKFDITSKCCEILKNKPAKIYLKKNNLFEITGIMASNSNMRKNNYIKYGCNIITSKTKKSRPLGIWKDEDIWQYIRKFKIPYCNIYDKGEINTGCAYCGFGCHLEKESRFERLKTREPKRYHQMMNLKNNGITYNQAIDVILKK